MKRGPLVSSVADQPGLRGKAARRFLKIFLVTVAVYYSLTLSPWVDANMLYPVMKASAHGTSVLLNLIGIKTTVEDVVIRGPSFAMAVRRGCDPLEPIVLFAAAVVSFPALWRGRLAGMALGSAFLFGLNLLRLVSLYLLGICKSPLFDSFHLWWWPAFFLLCSLTLWILWLLWVQHAGLASKSATRATPILKSCASS